MKGLTYDELGDRGIGFTINTHVTSLTQGSNFLLSTNNDLV